MRRAISIWPTLIEAQDRCVVLGNAHVTTNGTTFLAVPNELADSATAMISNLGHGTARSTDPETSHAAAALPRPGHQARVLDAHRARPDGLTDFELAAVVGLKQTSCGVRRAELTKAGLIEDSGLRRPSDTGTPSIVWKLITETRAA